MNKKDLVEILAAQNGLTKAAAERFINTFTDTIAEALVKGDKVQILGFGTFETKEKAGRNARNPKTGEAIKIAAKVAPKFKAGKALKDAVNK